MGGTGGRKAAVGPATAVLMAFAAVAAVPGARATEDGQIEPDITKLKYVAQGWYKAGDRLPDANDLAALPPRTADGRFNPSGEYHAFDTNVFETLALPYRAAGDKFADDPFGNGGSERHGFCAADGDPRSTRDRPGDLAEVAGECPNHQLEYLDHYERTMKDILGDFGATFHRYPFHNPGSSNTQSGTAYNPAAIVPGALYPDEATAARPRARGSSTSTPTLARTPRS